MAQLVWKREYAIGIDSIDAQHRSILMVFNAFLQNATPETYRTAYEDLGRLIEEHFRHEEAIMARHRLPNLAEHQAWHARMRADYESCIDLELNETTIGQMRARLYRWLVDHILNDRMDRGIAVNLRKMGIYQK